MITVTNTFLATDITGGLINEYVKVCLSNDIKHTVEDIQSTFAYRNRLGVQAAIISQFVDHGAAMTTYTGDMNDWSALSRWLLAYHVAARIAKHYLEEIEQIDQRMGNLEFDSSLACQLLAAFRTKPRVKPEDNTYEHFIVADKAAGCRTYLFHYQDNGEVQAISRGQTKVYSKKQVVAKMKEVDVESHRLMVRKVTLQQLIERLLTSFNVDSFEVMQHWNT